MNLYKYINLAIAVFLLLQGFLVVSSTKKGFSRTFQVINLIISFLIVLCTFSLYFIVRNNPYSLIFYRLDTFTTLNLPIIFGIDGISYSFCLLTNIIIFLCYLYIFNFSEIKYNKLFIMNILALNLFLLCSFMSFNLFWFYFFFESTLIPMFLIIGIWGSRSRKIKASYYFFLYTLFGSVLMLISMIYLFILFGSLDYYILLFNQVNFNIEKIIWLTFFLTFAIKLPIYPFHIWLPEAHVEAPTVGSVILAALLLKLGSFAIIKYLLNILTFSSIYFAPFVWIIGVVSIIFSSLSALRQVDIKKVIAYSSVAHMNFLLVGLFSFSSSAITGAIFLMIGHGFVSSSLFFLIGMLYERYGTKTIFYYGGLCTVNPILSLFSFFFFFSNIGFPGTINFVGEILIMLGVIQFDFILGFLIGLSIILSLTYSILMFNKIFFGYLNNIYIKKFKDIAKVEALVLSFLLFFIIFWGLQPNFFLDLIAPNSNEILNIIRLEIDYNISGLTYDIFKLS